MTPEEMMRRRLPRSVRNNNPGNLEASSWVQKQPGYIGSDGRFAIFETPDAGYSAMEGLLQSYSRRGLNTVGSIINRWSPQSDPTNQPGSTNNYVRSVAKAVGVSPTDEININDPELRGRLVRAMAEVEGGGKIPQMGAASGAASPMSFSPTQVASADDNSMGFMARRLLSGATGGLLGGNDGGKVPFDAERPYSPSFTAPQQPMGAQFAGAAPVGGIGSVPGGAAAALTSRPLPEPDKGWSMDKWSNRDIASLASVGNFLMAAGAPKQTWTPAPPPQAVRGKWRDDLFAGLLG